MRWTCQVSTDEILRTLDTIDLVELTATAQSDGADASDDRDGPTGYRTGPVRGPVSGPDATTVVEDPKVSTRFLLPTHALRAAWNAGLTVAAARQLASPGALTVSVLGSGLGAALQIRMMIRYLPGVSHVAICTSPAPADPTVTDQVIDELDLAGVGWSVPLVAADAVFGANLIVFSDGHPDDIEIPRISRGAVLVNASGRPLPAPVLDRLAHLPAYDLVMGGASRRTDGNVSAGGSGVGTLRQHLRWDPDRVLLVELLDVDAPCFPFAQRICHATRGLGLGRTAPATTKEESDS